MYNIHCTYTFKHIMYTYIFYEPTYVMYIVRIIYSRYLTLSTVLFDYLARYKVFYKSNIILLFSIV